MIAYRRHQGFSQSYPQSRGTLEALDDTWVAVLEYFWSLYLHYNSFLSFFFTPLSYTAFKKSLSRFQFPPSLYPQNTQVKLRTPDVASY